MAKLVGRVCGGKLRKRGHRFLKIDENLRVYDVTKEFTGRDAPGTRKRRKKPTKKKLRKSTSSYGRKRSGPLKGFASRKQKAAAMRNVKKAQKARRSRR